MDRRDAEEDVREIAEDSLFRERDEFRSDAAAARVRGDANDLDGADERALQQEDDEAARDAVLARHPHFAGWIRDARQALFEGAAEENPRIARRHHRGACARFGIAIQASDLQLFHCGGVYAMMRG